MTNITSGKSAVFNERYDRTHSGVLKEVYDALFCKEVYIER